MSTKKVVYVILMLLSLNTSRIAIAAPDAAGAVLLTGAISGIISDLKQAVSDVIANMDDAVSRNLFEGRQAGLLLIDQIDIVGQNLIGKTFEELNESEKRLFEDLNVSIHKLQETEKVAAEDIKKVVRESGNALSVLPFADKTPLVTEYKPSFIKSGGSPNSDFIKIKAMGILLGTGEPKLKISGTTCDAAGKSESELVFNCPKNIFQAESRIDAIYGDLTVYQNTGFLEGIKRFLGFGKELEEKAYKVPLYVIPSQLGTYSFSMFREEKVIERRSRSQGFEHTNDHCQGGRDKTFPFAPQTGWMIDTPTVKANCDSRKSSSCNGLRNVTANGFGYNCTIRNNGECVKAFGKVVSYDGRGQCKGTATWTDFRELSQRVQHNAVGGSIVWGKDVSIPLLENVDAVRLTVETINGNVIVLTQASSDPMDWFELETDYEARTVIIKPKSLESALD